MIVVYSCIVGCYDDPAWILRSQVADLRACQWWLFVDFRSLGYVKQLARSLPHPPYPDWQIHPTRVTGVTEPTRIARFHKARPDKVLPEATTVSIWLDGTQQVKPGTDIRVFVPDAPLATFRHPDRDCVYEEARCCAARGKDKPEVMAAQVAGYRALGYPEHQGLAETSCVVRQHMPEIQAFNRDWWEEMRKGSRRDQLSFDFVCWVRNIRYAWIPGRRDRSPYLRYRAHAG